jgi:basic membrane lipoprotein Med (substrate-binding protein (PBP1-ABC) superfamily)
MKLYINGKNKVLALFLTIAMLLMLASTFTACNKGNDDEGEEEITDEPVEEPITHKVGYIYNGAIAGSTHNLMLESSRAQLERDRGIETCYIENVLVKNFYEAVDILVKRDVTVIVSTTHVFARSVDDAAKVYKNVIFISYGGDNTTQNVTNFKPLLYQPANICGVAASYNTKSNTIGIITSEVMFAHESVVNAYILGVKEFAGRDDLVTHIDYVIPDNFADTKQAIDDMVAKGVDVIMLYLSTDYGIKYCEQIGVKVIAYSGNMPELAPNNYMTGFFVNVNSYISEQIMFVLTDYFFPAKTYGGIDTGGARLLPLNGEPTVVNGTKGLTDLLYEKIKMDDRVFSGQIIDNYENIQVPYGYKLPFIDALEINWMEISVGNNIRTLSSPLPEPVEVHLVVKGEWPDGVNPNAPVTTADDSDNTGVPETAFTPAPAKTEETSQITTALTEETTAEPTSALTGESTPEPTLEPIVTTEALDYPQ